MSKSPYLNSKNKSTKKTLVKVLATLIGASAVTWGVSEAIKVGLDKHIAPRIQQNNDYKGSFYMNSSPSRDYAINRVENGYTAQEVRKL